MYVIAFLRKQRLCVVSEKLKLNEKLIQRKQYIDLNFLSHFLSRKGLCERA